MNPNKIWWQLQQGRTYFEFEYHGRSCFVDTDLETLTGKISFILHYAGEDVFVDTPLQVMTTPFVEGRTLAQVANELVEVKEDNAPHLVGNYLLYTEQEF